MFPSPKDLKKKIPLSTDTALTIKKNRLEIQSIIQGKSPLWALILGPCSLHNIASALEYAEKLYTLQKKVEKTCLLVMRAHIEKPRTHLGWKGLLYDPFLDGSNQLIEGLEICRNLYIKISQKKVPIACEFLEPIASSYFSDLISWGFIGARTSSSQIHRQLASYLDMPIGFKNSTDGILQNVIQSALAAQAPHSFLHVDDEGLICQIQSEGNPFSHIVLRGTSQSPNYRAADIENTLFLCKKWGLSQRILIDCSHDNSRKKPYDQKLVCQNVLEQFLSGNEKIMGIMLESHLKGGSQPISKILDSSISITDPCIDWKETEELVLSVHESLLNSRVPCMI